MLKVETEIYSRVSGYFRPVKQWNKAKQAEFKNRKNLIYGEMRDEKICA